MLTELLWVPRLHGALGWWDELINLIPVVVGILLVLYLYRANRRRRDEAEHGPDREDVAGDSGPPPSAPPEPVPPKQRG
jgi:hypothetical protein